ncbi:MAG: phosphoglycerate kinase [Longimicrobiales bacterium]
MKKSVNDLLNNVSSGTTVSVRADFNVPISGALVVDPVRIDRALPTLEKLSAAGVRTVILSHLGRPGGTEDPQFSLGPVATYLATQGNFPVKSASSAVGEDARAAVAALNDGDVLLLENTRFLPGETQNDPSLGAEWASWSDHFVNDAFGTAHRAHASTDALPRAVRAKGGLAVAGLLLELELQYLGKALSDPDRPFVGVLGGAKISGKIDVIEALLPITDSLLIGGAMANTFFRALGLETGNSLVEPDKVELAKDLLDRAGSGLVLPVDCRIGTSIDPGAETTVVDRSDVPENQSIGDIGPTTEALFGERIREAETVVWNGPMGVFEMDNFAGGTFALAEAAAGAADEGTTVIIGGGDSGAAAEAAGVANRITHISTGGGASLEFLAGRPLPGVEALSDRS